MKQTHTRFGVVATLLAAWVVVAGCPSEESIEKAWMERKDKAQQVQARYPHMKGLIQQAIDEATPLFEQAKAKPEGERKDGLRAAISRLSKLMEPFEGYDKKHAEIVKLKADPKLNKADKRIVASLKSAADMSVKNAEALFKNVKSLNAGERAELLKKATALLEKGAAGLRAQKENLAGAATSAASTVTPAVGATAAGASATTCTVCSKKLKSAEGLADHMKASHAGAAAAAANTCTQCGKTLKSAQGLADHTKAAHPAPVGNACPTCGKKLKSAQGVKDHMKAVHGG